MDMTTLLVLVGIVAVVAVLAVMFSRKSHDLASASPERLAAHAREKADAYARDHEKATGERLDFSRATLKAIDTVLERNYAKNTLSDPTIEEMGFYLGEVIRRTFGGDWRYNEGFKELCIAHPQEGFIFPVSQIRRALEQKSTDHVQSYFDSIAERVKS